MLDLLGFEGKVTQHRYCYLNWFELEVLLSVVDQIQHLKLKEKISFALLSPININASPRYFIKLTLIAFKLTSGAN